jgi:cytochrome b561
MLYVAAFIMPLSGLALALQSRLPWILFGGGRLPPDFWVYPFRTVHYVASRVLIALIVLHVVGAMYHTLVLRDGLLRRMLFGRRVVSATSSTGAAEARS